MRLILLAFLPVLALAQTEHTADSWDDWKKELNLRYYNLEDCYCPWITKTDSTKMRDMMNHSPYKYDRSKPIRLNLDTAENAYLMELIRRGKIKLMPVKTDSTDTPL